MIINNQLGSTVINDMSWVEKDFIPSVQQEEKVIDARGASSATSAAKAAMTLYGRRNTEEVI